MPELTYVTLPTLRCRDNFVIENTSWHDLCAKLLVHKPLSQKHHGDALAPVKLKPKDDWIRKKKPFTEWNKTGLSSYRILDNVESISLVILDIDELDRYERFQSHKDMFRPFEFAMYSSFSYTPENMKMRVVLPLEESIPIAEWQELWAGITAIGGGDLACKDFFRAYLNPSYNSRSNVTPISYHNNSGRFLKIEDLKPMAELAKELYPEEYNKSKSRIRKSYDFSRIKGNNSLSSYRGEPFILSKNQDVALKQLLRDPKIRELIVDCAKGLIPRFEVALRLASHGVQKYRPEKFTYEIYETLSNSLISQLPAGKTQDTHLQLQEYYLSALSLVGIENIQPTPTKENNSALAL